MINLVGAGVGILVATVLALQKSRKSVANRLLAAALGCLSFDVLNHVLQFSTAGKPLVWMAQIAYPVGYLHVPFFYFYVRSLGEPNFKISRSLWAHFVPFFITAALVADMNVVLHIRDLLGIWTNPVFQTAQQFQQLVYAILIFRTSGRLTSLQGVELRWMRNLSLAISALASAAFLNTVTQRLLFSNLYLGASFLIVYVAYFGLTQPRIYAFEDEREPPRRSPTLSPVLREAKGQRLRALMESERPYLEGNLTLSKLSRVTRIPASELSLIINQELGKNFFDFVNEYRIEDAKKRMLEDDRSVLEIAFDVGFNSKSTFYAAFKRFENCTPLQFRERAKAD